MGQYINPGIEKFEMSLNSQIYVDKSNLIIQTNELIRSENRFICVSRPRRFGKTMALDMLATYYQSGESKSRIAIISQPLKNIKETSCLLGLIMTKTVKIISVSLERLVMMKIFDD